MKVYQQQKVINEKMYGRKNWHKSNKELHMQHK